MGTVSKAIVLVAAVLGIVTGVAEGFTWVHHQVSTFVWILIGLGACSAMWGSVEGLALPKTSDDRRRSYVVACTFDLMISAAIILLARSAVLGSLSVGLGFAIPSLVVLYWIDRLTHKECPKCSERVKAAASICRYCHHKFNAPRRVLYVVTDDVRRRT